MTRSVLFAIAASFVCLGVCLVVGQLFGTRPAVSASPAVAMIATVLIFGLTSARLFWVSLTSRRSPRSEQFLFLAITGAAVALIAIALSARGVSALGMTTVWLAAAAAETIVWYYWLRRKTRDQIPGESHAEQPRDGLSSPVRPGIPRVADDANLDQFDEEDEESGLLPEGVTQQLTRMTNESGQEVIYGLAQTEFTGKGRHCYIHIAFCPPLKCRPKITADTISGPTARVKVVRAETFGACFELKLSGQFNDESPVVLEFFATEATSDTRA